jgi:hypothetical protein
MRADNPLSPNDPGSCPTAGGASFAQPRSPRPRPPPCRKAAARGAKAPSEQASQGPPDALQAIALALARIGMPPACTGLLPGRSPRSGRSGTGAPASSRPMRGAMPADSGCSARSGPDRGTSCGPDARDAPHHPLCRRCRPRRPLAVRQLPCRLTLQTRCRWQTARPAARTSATAGDGHDERNTPPAGHP